MGVLKLSIGLIICLLFASSGWSLTPEEALEVRKAWKDDGSHGEHCSSTKEYIQVLTFLRQEKEYLIPENQSRKLAELVAQGCDGAAERFSKAFLTLKRSGVSLQKTVDVSLVLSRANPATVKNFYEVFKKLYLKEYFDFDYKTSFEATMSLSVDYYGNLDNALQDFNKLSEFCLNSKNLGLSVIQCSELSLKIAKLSQYYKTGVYPSFERLFEVLRGDKKFSLSVRDALIKSEQILSHGPKAVDNFISAYEFALSKEGLSLKGPEAVEFAMRLAKLSHKGEAPPLFPGDHLMPASF